ELRDAVRRAAVLSYLVRDCLGLTVDAVKDLERAGFDLSEIELLGIRSCPSRTFNLIGAGACYERFGDLSDIGFFYKCGACWWIDLDERLSRRGLVFPLRETRYGLINDLLIFRHAADPHPFKLRFRRERRAE